jgi:Family of unknown function (DUF5302)
MTVRLGGDADRYQPPARRHAGITCAKLWIWPFREEVCMTDAAPEPEGSEEEPEGSEEKTKRKFREALERKSAKHADANAAPGGKDAGKVHGARGLARSRRSFRRKTGG